jgi:hypothetical protein
MHWYTIKMTKAYTGGCHCKKVQYEVELELELELENVISCNCSICLKRGWLLAFAPKNAFKLITGEDELTDYQFNKHLIHHLFCSTCGTASYSVGSDAEGNESIAINVRCLDNVDLDMLAVVKYDGRSA